MSKNFPSWQVTVTMFLLLQGFFLSSDRNERIVDGPNNPDERICNYQNETMSEFPGGQKAFNEYIKQNLKYPEKAKNDRVEGQVYVSFNINEEGKIDSISVMKGVSREIDWEAIRLVQQMPSWKPAIRNGKPIMIRYTIPIVFKL